MIDLMLFRRSETEDYVAGQIIFKEGEPGDKMYVISEGEVDILIGHDAIETARPGTTLGEIALIDQSPRSATALARTDCKLVPIDARRFQFLVQQTPFFALTVMKIMADRLRRTNARITST